MFVYTQGILDAYHYSLRLVDLFGPTNFSPIILKTIEMANQTPTTQDSQNYYILLIITVSHYCSCVCVCKY